MSATDVLYGRLESAPYFRSTKTGLSFQDLVYEFEYLMDVHVMEIFSDIYSYQITRDKSVLLSMKTTSPSRLKQAIWWMWSI